VSRGTEPRTVRSMFLAIHPSFYATEKRERGRRGTRTAPAAGRGWSRLGSLPASSIGVETRSVESIPGPPIGSHKRKSPPPRGRGQRVRLTSGGLMPGDVAILRPQFVLVKQKGWGPKRRALVLVLQFCTAYPHFHSNGSAMKREHSPWRSRGCCNPLVVELRL
jgi:hypothetical protein